MSAPLLTPAEVAACRAVIARHSRSFFLASRLLPRASRDAAWALYAFSRVADDLIDGDARGAALKRRVEVLGDRLERVYRGTALDDPIERAFARFVEAHAVPRALPNAMLTGFELDAEAHVYETLDDLLGYAFCVAGTVGLMMARALGAPGAPAGLRAAELGIAMQLTNIARDLGEDAKLGRCYVPRAIAREVGFAPQALAGASGEASPGTRRAVRWLLAAAEAHYRSAERGIALLPVAARPAIACARHLYAAIGEEIARRGDDPLGRRAAVPAARRWGLVLRAGGALVRGPEPATFAAPGPADDLLRGFLATVGLPPEAGPGAGAEGDFRLEGAPRRLDAR